MRMLQKYFCLILTAMVLIVPDLCHAARNVVQRNTDEITQHNVSQNATSAGRTTNRATTNTARAGNNARRETSTSRRESSSRGTASRTSNAGARATQSRTARTAQAGRTSAVTARNASAQVRSATNTRAARSAATAHVAPTTAVKSRAATSVQPRASANNVMARTRNASAVSLVNNNIADLMAQCKTKYTQCMDDFCNVLDDAQGRCSCSKNLKNYAKTSTAQDEANAALQDIAQQIQYIGLSRDEIETVFKQTEAELALQGGSDNSQIKNSLDKIKDMIVEVKPGTASAADADTGFSFNLDGLLDFSFDSVGFDLTSLFGTNSANTSSINNQRGEQLYKTASARCKKNVLEACQAQGINTVLIENSYDLEIDRACIAYEKELTGGNDNIAQTVRNAQSVLQRARLMVAQQKNIYDLRKCVGALDSCMQDDFVCGGDYELCLDPTGKYIVEGEVVVGSTPGYTSNANPASDYAKNTLMGTWYYDNKFAWAPTPQEGSLIEYIAKYVTSKPIKNTSSNIAEFLQYKIGYNEDGKNYGMCMSVLNKCQDLTYDKTSGKYIPNNQVVTEYLTRTLTQIKSTQDKILFEYAENCITDVASCLSSNNFDTAATEKKQNIAINACRAQIKTCMSVNGNSSNDPGELRNWVVSMMGAYDEEDELQPESPGQSGTSVPGAEDEKNCVASGGTWSTATQTCSCNKVGTTQDSTEKLCVCDTANNFAGTPNKNSGCQCAEGYEFVNGACQLKETGSESGGSEPEQPEQEQPEQEQPSIAQQNCENTGGEWTDNTCECGDGYAWKDSACISTEQDACERLGKEWTDNTCECGTGYTWKDSACISTEQVACERLGKEWTDNTCKCGDGYVWKGLMCKSDEMQACENEGGTWESSTCVCGNGDKWYENRCISNAEYECVATKGEDASGNGITGIWENGTCTCPGSLVWYTDDCMTEEQRECLMDGFALDSNGKCNKCSGTKELVYYDTDQKMCLAITDDSWWCGKLGGTMKNGKCETAGATYWRSNGQDCRNSLADSIQHLNSIYTADLDIYNINLCMCSMNATDYHTSGRLGEDGQCGCMATFVPDSSKPYANQQVCTCEANKVLMKESASYESTVTEMIYTAYYGGEVADMAAYNKTLIDIPVVSGSPFYAEQLLHRSITLGDWFVKDENGQVVTMPCNLSIGGDKRYHCQDVCIEPEKLQNFCEASGGQWDSADAKCGECQGRGRITTTIKDFSSIDALCSCSIEYMWDVDPNKNNSCRCPEYVSTATGRSIQLQPMTELDMQDANKPELWGLDSMPEWDKVAKCVLPGTLIVHADSTEANEYHWACDEKHGFVDPGLYVHDPTISPSGSGHYYELLEYFLKRNSQENPVGYAPTCVCKTGLTQVYDAAKQKNVCVTDESAYRDCGYENYNFAKGECNK